MCLGSRADATEGADGRSRHDRCKYSIYSTSTDAITRIRICIVKIQ